MLCNKAFSYSLFVLCLLFSKVYLYPDHLSVEQRKKLAEHFTNYGIGCLDDHKINFDDIMALQALKVPRGKEAACFFACILKRAEMMNAEGTITPESVLKVAQAVFQNQNDLEQAIKVFTSCAYVNDQPVSDGTKGCERSILALQCLIQQSDRSDPAPSPDVETKDVQIDVSTINVSGNDSISKEQRKIARIIVQTIITTLLQLACTGFVTATKINVFPLNILTNILPTTLNSLCSLVTSH